MEMKRNFSAPCTATTTGGLMGPEALTRRTGGRRGGEGEEEKIEGGGPGVGEEEVGQLHLGIGVLHHQDMVTMERSKGSGVIVEEAMIGREEEGAEEVTMADMGVREEADTMMLETTMIIGEMRGEGEVGEEETSGTIAGATEVEVVVPSEARIRINSSSSSSKREATKVLIRRRSLLPCLQAVARMIREEAMIAGRARRAQTTEKVVAGRRSREVLGRVRALAGLCRAGKIRPGSRQTMI